MKIALLGAESTGKSQLASELAAHLNASGQSAIAVSEYLREWCELEGCTPQPHEQTHIAHTQKQRIEQAALQASWVIADTTPLMTAVYSEFVFSDTLLYEEALTYQKSFDITLITGLDMPWEADGIQRDGPHVRAPVDALLRQILQHAGIAFEVIYGQDKERLQAALHAIERFTRLSNAINTGANHADSMPANAPKDFKKWQWNCEKCSDPDCEHRLFHDLIHQAK